MAKNSPKAEPAWTKGANETQNDAVREEARRLLEAERLAAQEADERNPVLPSVRANSLGCATILMDRFFTENGVRIIARCNGAWFLRKRGAWRDQIEDDIDQLIQQKLSLCRQVTEDGELVDFNVSCAAQAEIRNQIASLVNIDSKLKPPVQITEQGWAEVDIIGKMLCHGQLVDMETSEAISMDRMFYLGGTEWKHDPAATAPIWEGFLDQLFPNAPDDRAMLAQWFGYVLSSSTRMQKALLIEGPPRAGKGVIGHILTELVGKSFVASPSLQDLSKDFGLQDLLEKKLLLSSDVRLSSRTDIMAVVEKILRITGGDALSISRKHTSAVQTELGVRVMLLTNSTPHITDNNEAFFSRFLIIRLENSFLHKEDPYLLEKLKLELSGIANWAMRGYQSLMKIGRFTESESSGDARKEWHHNSNPIARFIDECCDKGAFDQYETTPDDLYAAYVKWAKYLEKLRNVEVKDWMMRNLYATLGDQVKRKKTDGGSKKVVVGIALKAEKLDELKALEKKDSAF